MNKNKSEETSIEEQVIETIEDMEVETPQPTSGGEIQHPKRGWFFPNIPEGKPFGGEFETLEEAQAANEKHLKENK